MECVPAGLFSFEFPLLAQDCAMAIKNSSVKNAEWTYKPGPVVVRGNYVAVIYLGRQLLVTSCSLPESR